MRRSRNAVFLGVVGGIAEHFAIGSTLLRIIALLAMCSTGFLPALSIYLLLALVMERPYY